MTIAIQGAIWILGPDQTKEMCTRQREKRISETLKRFL